MAPRAHGLGIEGNHQRNLPRNHELTMSKIPHMAEADAKKIAKKAIREAVDLQTVLNQQERPYWQSALSDVAKAGIAGAVLAGAVDVGVQLYTTGQIDWGNAGVMALLGAGSAGAGAAAHHLVMHAAINNAAAYQFYTRIANAVGLPTGMAAASIIGKSAGGTVGSVVYALGMYATGKIKAGEAAYIAALGAMGSIAGTAAGGAMVAFATAYGTAGTGVAISSLSGAAANSAALAWLGGGSVAAGGGGVALGTVFVSGGTAIVAIAVTALAHRIYVACDNSQTNHRVQYNARNLINTPDVLEDLCKRQWFPRLASAI